MEKRIKTTVLTNYMEENGLSKADFCTSCKINLSTLNRILANNNDVRISTLFRIARILHIEITELLHQ